MAKYSDVVLAVLVVAVIGMIIIPLPTWLIDILLTINITIGVLILLVALYVSDALKIASFPTLLLITTIFRLALNISSTRLILSQGHAGEVIEAFGSFVLGGTSMKSMVVGMVIFLIITLVNFIVIAKGAERVSEVGARFTLDAMPGKQMSIDADLRAGIINMEQAMERREILQRESQMYGAMDGAMKFV
ncbi:MAG TPA: FHIPEP family type III secretion protein, partial [bacterium]|nr:FHIPEP family type III secretion protein [bacterium]